MNITSRFIGLIIFGSSAFAQARIDTLAVLPAGPGAIHMRLVAPAVPWTINVLKVNLKDPYISTETVKAQDLLRGYERTSSMAARNSSPGHVVIGGVNGDFYGTGGIPINVQILNGEIVRTPISLSALGFDADKRPVLHVVSFSGQVTRAAAASAIHGVNETRDTDLLILYNRFYGASTSTNSFGAEALLEPLTPWTVNDTVRCRVGSIIDGVGDMSIPPGKAVLSGHGTARSWMVTNLQLGDTIRLLQQISPALPRLMEMIGGFPRIVHNGIDYVDQGYAEEGGPPHTYERHPRTGAGFSADSSMLLLVTVDGRQPTSAGMTLHELAQVMIDLGIHHGINFDGGGSTTMVVNGSVVNSPSDGGVERSVANALLTVSSAPTGTLNRIYLNPRKYRVFRGESFSFLVDGADEYGYPSPLDTSLLRFSCPPHLGSIDARGTFTAASIPDSGYVRLEYGALSDSAFVTIKDVGRILLEPRASVTDTFKTLAIRARAFDWDDVEKTLPAKEFEWTTTDPGVGVVDSMGVFKGKSSGTTGVVAQYKEVTDTATVTVQIGTGGMLLDSMESTTRWGIVLTNVDPTASSLRLESGFSTLGGYCLMVQYSFVYDPSKLPTIALRTDIPLFGLPDSILIDARADSANHRIFFQVEDAAGGLSKLYTPRFINHTVPFDTLGAPAYNPTFIYPIRFKGIEVQFGSRRVAGTRYSGAVYLDNLRVTYPGMVTAVTLAPEAPGRFRLEQNYPNPFNPTTTIAFSLEAPAFTKLGIYDVLGREVAELVNERLQEGSHRMGWNATGQASGVYFTRLQSGGRVEVRKLVLMK